MVSKEILVLTLLGAQHETKLPASIPYSSTDQSIALRRHVSQFESG